MGLVPVHAAKVHWKRRQPRCENMPVLTSLFFTDARCKPIVCQDRLWTNIRDIIETKRAFCDMSQVLRQSDPAWLRSETHMECESRWAGRHRHPTPATRRHPHHTGDRSHRNPAQIRCRCYTTTRRHAPRQPRRGRARRTGCAGTAARAVVSAQASCSAVGCEVFSRSGEREERGKSKVPNENLELGLGT